MTDEAVIPLPDEPAEVERLPDEPEPEPEPEKVEEGEKSEPEPEETEGEEGDGDKEEEPPKKRRRPSKTEREISKLNATVDALKEALLSRKEEPKAPAAPPRQEDFPSYEDFVSAKARYEVRQEMEAEKAKEREQEQARRRENAQRSFADKARSLTEAGRTDFADYDEVVTDDLPITQEMALVLMEMEAGQKVTYHLGKNPDEAARIAKMHPLSAARELAKLEVKLTTQPAKKQTSAPKPPNTLGGGDKPLRDPSRMSMEEYRLWREKGG